METQTAVLDVMRGLKQQPNTPEESTAEYISLNNRFQSKISQLQKQRLFKRRSTQRKSASWNGKGNNVCGKS